MIARTTVFIGSALLSVILVVSGLSKLASPWAFTADVYDYQILEPWSGAILANLLPGFEVFVGLALLVGPARPVGSVIVAGLMAVFLAAQVYAVALSLDISCGCFGASDQSVGPGSIMRTAGLLAVALCLSVAGRYVTPVEATSGGGD